MIESFKELKIPTIPNAPFLSRSDKTKYGKLSLQKNILLDLYTNATYKNELTVYDSSYQNNQTHSLQFKKHLKEVYLIFKTNFDIGSKVVDVGCGKGDFVDLLNSESYYEATGYDTTYEGNNEKIHKRYLNENDKINSDVITLRHVIEYIPSPHLFLSMLHKIFGDVNIYIEQLNFDWTIKNQIFTDITYERVNYFTKQALSNLFTKSKSGDLFNSQYQYVIANLKNINQKYDADFSNNRNWTEENFYSLFPQLQTKIQQVSSLVNESNKTMIWGASSKGCMFLHHYINIIKSINHIEFAVDINPNKVDKFLPSSYIPIKSPDFFYSNVSDNDLVIISNENYEAEITSDILKNSNKKIKIISL